MWLLLLSLSWSGELEERAERLAELRSEVSMLAADVDAERASVRGRLRALDAERAEMQGQIRREALRSTELSAALAERREILAVQDASAADLTPVLRESLAGLRERMAQGLPYRTDERIAAVDALTAQLDSGELRPEKALGRVWQLVEDELRLTRETAMDRQVIAVDGRERLVDVARVGMVSVYARDGGRFLQAIPRGGAWTWERSSDSAGIAGLFDALDKQVNSGFFTLPGLPLEERS
jgi:hypothetical protein